MMSRSTRKPSFPPSRATRGSQCTSGMSAGKSPVGMYGGFATTRSADPAGTWPSTACHRSPRRNVIRLPTPCCSALARATRRARDETSVARIRAVGSSLAKTTATAPEPVQSSTIVGPASWLWISRPQGRRTRLAFLLLLPGRKGGLDERLRLRPRHQDIWRDREGEGPELARSEDVGQRLTPLAALEQTQDLAELFYGKASRGLEYQLPTGTGEDRGQQALRVEPRRLDSGLLQQQAAARHARLHVWAAPRGEGQRGLARKLG